MHGAGWVAAKSLPLPSNESNHPSDVPDTLPAGSRGVRWACATSLASSPAPAWSAQSTRCPGNRCLPQANSARPATPREPHVCLRSPQRSRLRHCPKTGQLPSHQHKPACPVTASRCCSSSRCAPLAGSADKPQLRPHQQQLADPCMQHQQVDRQGCRQDERGADMRLQVCMPACIQWQTKETSHLASHLRKCCTSKSRKAAFSEPPAMNAVASIKIWPCNHAVTYLSVTHMLHTKQWHPQTLAMHARQRCVNAPGWPRRTAERCAGVHTGAESWPHAKMLPMPCSDAAPQPAQRMEASSFS